MSDANAYDYIVVGAGAAGCVLAERLSADPSVTVLLLEHGGPDRNPLLHVPKGFYFVLRGERYTYKYVTQPVGPAGRPETWVRGKVSGGSTSVNGMIWVRGAPADYDALADRGNRGWGWADMGPALAAVEERVGVSITHQPDSVSDAIVTAAVGLGLRPVDDFNDGDDERIGDTPASIRNGLRSSAATAFLRPAMKRRNLTVRNRTRVGYLRFDGARVTGVVTSNGEHTARREVIVAAGTVETPLLLERSGIGRPSALEAAGIDVRVESPNVGERIVEQRGIGLQVRLQPGLGLTSRLDSVAKQGVEGMRYLFTRRGPIAGGGYDLTCAFRSSPAVERPDVQGIFMPMAVEVEGDRMKLAPYAGATFLAWPIRPTTTSSVHAGGPAPEDAPLIRPRYLESDEDRVATGPILDWARRLFASDPVAAMVDAEVSPGPSVATHDDVVRFAQDTPAGIYHAVGSAAMGPNDDDVVDDRLRVRGVEGLRVVDASVFPAQPAGNSAAPTMALAWRAADLLRAGE